MGRMGRRGEGRGLREGEGVKASMLSPSQCVSRSVEARAEYPFGFSGETLHWSVQFDSVLLCVYVETVILGRAFPGSAGSAHWTISSSGVRPDPLPS